MDAAGAEKAAALIWRHWQEGSAMTALPAGLAPATRAEGYAIQARLEAYSAAPRAGWKIAATSLGGQRHIGVDGPLAGRLLAERLHAPDARVSLEGNRMRVAEPEFAFRLGRDLAPRETPRTEAEAMEAAVALHLTIELPDSRFADFARASGPALIADNACARDLVVGPEVTAPWREADLAGQPVRIRAVGGATEEGTGAAVLGDPRRALTWLVNEVTGLGLTIRAGELITTGVCTVPLPVAPGDRVEADFGSFGMLAVGL